jgi:uncharacterized repeat protein (TIGR01451 family)
MKKRILAIAIVALGLAAMVATTAGAATGDSADLGVTVSADKTAYKVGDLVTYTVTITNYGESAADKVTFTDLLPAGLTLVSTDLSTSPDASGDASFTSSSVDAGALVRDPILDEIDPTGSAAYAARIADGARLDLGVDVGTSAGRTLVTGNLGWLGSRTYWSDADSTETITIVARATAAGQLANVASVDSTTNPDPYSMSNYAAVSVAVS